jgi:hypothetical protein
LVVNEAFQLLHALIETRPFTPFVTFAQLAFHGR